VKIFGRFSWVENEQIKGASRLCSWHVQGVKRNAQTILVEKSEVKIPLVRPTHVWVDVKTDLKSDRKMQLDFIWLKTEPCGGPL